MSQRTNIEILDHDYSIHRLALTAAVTMPPLADSLFSVVIDSTEMTVICRTATNLPSQHKDAGWRVLRLVGPLELSLVGILAHLANALAAAGLCLFVVSSFATDYILVRQDDLDRAQAALVASGYRFVP